MKRPKLVAVAGGSASGKTWLADRLAEVLNPPALRLALDDFYRDLSHLAPARRGRVNFDHPRAIDWSLLEEVLDELTRGRTVAAPGYDFATHCRRPDPRRLVPRSVVVVEGLWLLRRPTLRARFDLKVFLRCDAALRLERRLARDVRERGRSEESVRHQFETQVEPMHARFVESQAHRADVVLDAPVGEREVARLAARITAL
ncbi:MAG: uridine kinase [Verrucomicrobiae bacterium]|nr:uridine kinase [Verrucomicrobiae bacterium]